jgi:16S rRNA G966 N2-methylase RsmD|tara:strand:+ start:52 stop:960 length:909 start_codon:yes stop_codon:yes gene_type:complete
MNTINLFGNDLFGEPIEQQLNSVLMKEFTIPPFSVLDARQGYWSERKRAWKSLGIQSELGRKSGMTFNTHSMGNEGFTEETNTSMFDPVLSEICCKWFCPSGGQVVDPFAGGSVRGIVATTLGFKYWGCDIREEQIIANREQARIITPEHQPEWVVGDAMEVLDDAPDADFIFSCPPYGDLEKYSDDPRDISTMDYHAFIAAYKRIILRASKRLKENRFACFVVGDFRDKKSGFFRDFVSDTSSAFKGVGMSLYNEAILATPLSTAPLRAGGQFRKSRKLCKAHQNVLIFVKGEPKLATKII